MVIISILFFQFFVFAHAVHNSDVELKLRNLESVIFEKLSHLENSLSQQKEENAKLKLCLNNEQKELLKLKQDMALQKKEILDMKKEIIAMKSEKNNGENWTVDTQTYKRNGSVGHLTERQMNGNKIVVSDRERRLLMDNTDSGHGVAFYAYMSNSEPIQKHKTLVFDVTMVNYANGYNSNTGIFTSPVGGVYVLTFTVHPNTNSYASVEVIINTKVHGAIFSDSSDGSDTNASTAVVIAWMNQGDVSFVRTHTTYGSTGTLYSAELGRCSFAGWKISN